MNNDEINSARETDASEANKQDASNEGLMSEGNSEESDEDSTRYQDDANGDSEIIQSQGKSIWLRLWNRFINWKNDPFRERAHWSNIATIWLTLVIIGVGAIQACIYHAQLTVMSGQLDSMQHQANDTEVFQSAELVIGQITITDGANGFSKATFTVSNVGLTPARRIVFAGAGGLWNWRGVKPEEGLIDGESQNRIMQNIAVPEPMEWGAPLGPGQTLPFEMDIPATETLMSRKQGYLGFAVIAYEDVFRKKKSVCAPVLFSPELRTYLSGSKVQDFCVTLSQLKQRGNP